MTDPVAVSQGHTTVPDGDPITHLNTADIYGGDLVWFVPCGYHQTVVSVSDNHSNTWTAMSADQLPDHVTGYFPYAMIAPGTPGVVEYAAGDLEITAVMDGAGDCSLLCFSASNILSPVEDAV